MHRRFFLFSVLGFLFVLLSSHMLFRAERNRGTGLDSYFDAVWFTVNTASSLGYVESVPETRAGKSVAMMIMLVGSVFFWGFVAFSTTALIAPMWERDST